jgi:CHASE2 domain-containing sensor protein
MATPSTSWSNEMTLDKVIIGILGVLTAILMFFLYGWAWIPLAVIAAILEAKNGS